MPQFSSSFSSQNIWSSTSWGKKHDYHIVGTCDARESHNYTSRCGNIMRLIFARTARRPIAHALHPIHIGGYFLHCNILYPYLLISYSWNVFDNVVWKLYPLRSLLKMKRSGVYIFYVLTPRNCLCISSSPNWWGICCTGLECSKDCLIYPRYA